MDPQTILRIYDEEERRSPHAGPGEVHRLPGLTYLLNAPPGLLSGWVIYTNLEEQDDDQAIRSTIDFFRPLGGEFEWKVYDHDRPADLKERLLSAGFVPEEREALLVFDLQAAPPEFWEGTPEGSIHIERLSDPAQVDEIIRIEAQVWGEPFDDLGDFLRTRLQQHPDRISLFLAYAGGKPASSAWTLYEPGSRFAGLYGGATLPDQRGRGLYRALVQARAREARQRGVRFLSVDASPMSRPILERLGFVYLTSSQPFIMRFDGE